MMDSEFSSATDEQYHLDALNHYLRQLFFSVPLKPLTCFALLSCEDAPTTITKQLKTAYSAISTLDAHHEHLSWGFGSKVTCRFISLLRFIGVIT